MLCYFLSGAGELTLTGFAVCFLELVAADVVEAAVEVALALGLDEVLGLVVAGLSTF